MDFKDISSRLKGAQKGPDPRQAEAKSVDFAQSYQIRARMVGVLLRDARLSASRSVEDCARLLDVTTAQFEAWEYGEAVPSLPQIEILAFHLGVPVSHFWGSETLVGDEAESPRVQAEYLALRDRMVGALLRQAREEAELSVEALAEMTGIPAAQLARYELGEDPMPMHTLSVLAGAVRRNMNYFLEDISTIGQRLNANEEWKHFAGLPDEIRQFAANPLNIGFIEIAYMLSQMPTDRLRRIGESMLDITM